MKWKFVVAKAIRDDAAIKLLQETAEEMQSVLDFVKDTEPELYNEFKSRLMCAINGSVNNGYIVDNDEYVTYCEYCV